MAVEKHDHPTVKFVREGFAPTLFCPGCGSGIVMNALADALARLGIASLDKFVFVSGIGCAAWIPSPHLKADSIHTLHGRAVPVATGVKLSKPELNVVVISGDGDLAGIGLNHLIHAARRNVEILVVMVNNMLFAMTGGQHSPTTPEGLKTRTAPYGNPERPIDVCRLVADAGAAYSARWTTGHVIQLSRSIERGLTKTMEGEGLAFVEVVSQCPARMGRLTGMTAPEMVREYVRRSIPLEKFNRSDWRFGERIPVGVYVDREGEGFVRRYYRVVSGGGRV